MYITDQCHLVLSFTYTSEYIHLWSESVDGDPLINVAEAVGEPSAICSLPLVICSYHPRGADPANGLCTSSSFLNVESLSLIYITAESVES